MELKNDKIVISIHFFGLFLCVKEQNRSSAIDGKKHSNCAKATGLTICMLLMDLWEKG
jgi:uncharacterized membrane protein